MRGKRNYKKRDARHQYLYISFISAFPPARPLSLQSSHRIQLNAFVVYILSPPPPKEAGSTSSPTVILEDMVLDIVSGRSDVSPFRRHELNIISISRLIRGRLFFYMTFIATYVVSSLPPSHNRSDGSDYVLIVNRQTD